jgi:NADP-dependent 3-hydroxy acid dehydrogenase YdfG
LDIIFANAGVADSSPMEKVIEQDFDRIYGGATEMRTTSAFRD